MAKNAIESDFQAYKMAKVTFWSEMVRSAIESDFRASKMAGGNLKKKLRIDLIWREMQ